MAALTLTALVLAAGCSSPAPRDHHSAAAPGPRASRSDEGRTAAADRSLTVAAAPATAATASASPGKAGGQSRAHKTPLKVRSYDSRTRRAVIYPSSNGSSASDPTATPRNASVGDVIASAPAPGAPHGLLAEVTKVIGATDAGTEVQTEPAALNALLGDGTAHGTVPVDPAAFDVDKLLPDVKVSWAKAGDVRVGPEAATVPLGSLRLDVRATVPTEEGAAASATVSGFVQVAPRVDFTYGGAGTDSAPGSAYLGVSGGWTSGWALKGRAAASATPLRIPFAKLHADPVLQVGPVPVVVNLDLTCYFQISGDGRVTVDVEQRLGGDFKTGGAFTPAKGWTPVDSADMTGTPVHSTVTTAGSVKAALGAEATVGLYGAVGVTADLAPYLRGEASGTVGSAAETASWAAYGGVELTGTLRIQLSVFGTPAFEHAIPLGTLHREWKLAGAGPP